MKGNKIVLVILVFLLLVCSVNAVTSDRIGFGATANQSGLITNGEFNNGLYFYNGTYESPVGTAHSDAFGSNTTYQYMPAHFTTTASVIAGTDQVASGKLTVTDGTYTTVITKLKSYKFAGGEYEFSFDNNNDGGSITDLNGCVIGVQDLDNFYRITIGNDTVNGMSNISIQKKISSGYTVVNTTGTNATYTRSNKNWIKAKFDPNNGVLNAWLRDDAGAYTSEPTITGYIAGTMPYGYFGFYSTVGLAGAGNLNVDYDDLTVKAELKVGETNIPQTEAGFTYSNDFTASTTPLWTSMVGDATKTYGGAGGVLSIVGGTSVIDLVRADVPKQMSYGTYLYDVKFVDTHSELTKTSRFALGWDGTYASSGRPKNGYSVLVASNSTGAASKNKLSVTTYVNDVGTNTGQWSTDPILDGTNYPIKIVWNTDGTMDAYIDYGAGYVLLGTTTADTTYSNGYVGFGCQQTTAANINVVFDNFSFTGTRYYLKPMLRGASQGEFQAGASVVKATRYTTDFDWNVINEFTQTTGTWSIDTVTGILGKSNTGRSIIKTNTQPFGDGAYQTTLNFKSLTSSVIGYVILWDGTSDGATIPYNSVYIRVSSGGLFGMFLFDGVGGNTAIGTSTTLSPVPVVNSPITMVTTYNSTTGVLIANAYSTSGTLLGTTTGTITTGRTGYVGLVQTGVSTVVTALSLGINALESTSTNGIQTSISGVPHGDMYGTANNVNYFGFAPLPIAFNDVSPYYSQLNPITSRNWTFQGIVVGNNTETSFSTATSPSASFREGNFTIRLYDTSSGGTLQSQQTFTVNVIANPLPTADFLGTPLTGCPPINVSFVDFSTGDGIYSWLWTFGDGNTSTQRNPINTYVSAGTFSVSLTATNLDGSNTITKTGYVTITPCTGPTLPAGTGEQWCGRQTLFFQNNSATIPAGYNELSNYPSGYPEIIKNTTLKLVYGYVLLGSFITPPNLPNIDRIESGLWRFHSYDYVDNSTYTTVTNFSVFKWNASYANETYLFSTESADIDYSIPTEMITGYVSPSNITMIPSDRLVVKVYGKTTNPLSTILSFAYQGMTHTSNIESGYFYCDPFAHLPTTTPTPLPAMPNVPFKAKPFEVPLWGWVLLCATVILLLMRRRRR